MIRWSTGPLGGERGESRRDRVTAQTTPDASVTTQTFGAGGLLQAIAVHVRGAVTPTAIVSNIDYNARGQRTLIAYGNGSETTYTYDPRTFRVRRIHTERPHANAALRTVQDLRYHYDPSGNITRIRDDAQQGVFFVNAYVDGTQSFKYDPTYRLIRATGREHAVLTVPTPKGFIPISHPQDSQAQDTYTQTYLYDAVGNIKRMTHACGVGPGWERGYDYHPGSNRLRATSVDPDLIEEPENYTDDSYEHDEHGNMIAMSAIPGGLTWDEDDRLQATDDVGGGITYYVYDGSGQRVRKVNVKNSTRKQRLYFGAWELYRDEHNINTTPVLDLERATLHVHDDTGRICLIEAKTAEDDEPIVAPANIARYQYSNHLGSAALELDDDAEVISYEEFHPYGTSSYAAANSAIEVSPKRYRYTGKERDEETGLAYHGARYYAPWLARWIAADPTGIAGGIDLFEYAYSNPIRFADLSGNAPTESQAQIPPELWDVSLPAFGITDKTSKTPKPSPATDVKPGRFVPKKQQALTPGAGAPGGVTTPGGQAVATASAGKSSKSQSTRTERAFALAAVMTGEKINFGAEKSTIGASWGRAEPGTQVSAGVALGVMAVREVAFSAAVGLLGKAAWALRKLGGEKFAKKLDDFAASIRSPAKKETPPVPESTGALKEASDAATKAAADIDSWVPKNKHMLGGGSQSKNRFNTQNPDDARAIVKEAIESPNAMFLPNEHPGTFQVVTDLGRAVGVRGEQRVRIMINLNGRVFNAFPVHNR